MRFDNYKFHRRGSKYYLSPYEQFKNNCKYSLYFVSLIAPDFRSPEHGSGLRVRLPLTLPRTVRVKRSYLMLAWFAYLLDVHAGDRSERMTKLAILPARRSLYTLQKAPMAHKTNSKEQFMFRFYSFKFTTKVTTPLETLPSSVNEALMVFYLVRRSFPAFETNLLFLKYYQVSIAYAGGSYFDLFRFSKRL